MSFEKYVASPIDALCDDPNAIELSKNAVCHKYSKHIDIRYHFTREFAEKKQIYNSLFTDKYDASGYSYQGITEMRAFAWCANVEFERGGYLN